MPMPRCFTLDDFLSLQQPAPRVPLHLAPDGALLAVSVQPKRRTAVVGGERGFTAEGVALEMAGSRVVVIDTATGAAREPFPPGSISWGAQWSPDGTWLAAYVQHDGPACLGLWRRATGDVRLLREAPVRPFFGFEVPRWTPDSRALIVKLIPASPAAPEDPRQPPAAGAAAPVAVFSAGPRATFDPPALPGFTHLYRCDLALVDIASGASRWLARDWHLCGWEVAPDGGAVATLKDAAADATRQQSYFDLVVVPLDGGAPRTVAARIPQAYGTALSWSPDGRHLAYTTAESGRPGRLFVATADGSGPPVALSPEDGPSVARDYEAPRWSADGRRVSCVTASGVWEFAADRRARRHLGAPEGRELLGWALPPVGPAPGLADDGALLGVVRDRDTKRLAVARLGLDRGQATPLVEAPREWADRPFGVAATPDGGAAYLLLEAAGHPPEVWRLGGAREPRRLWSPNPALEDVARGQSRLVAYRALDGERRQAALLLPPGYTAARTVPLVVDVYGGRLGSDRLHRFGGNESVISGQLLASRGYAVLYPDLPLADRDPLRQLPGQVVPAVNHLIDLGIADPARVGLMGQSYGGYCALALLTQTGIFRAAVAVAGMTNLTSFYGILSRRGDSQWLGWAESGQGRLGGSPWERREAYIENSPLFYLDRVETPVLLVSGTAYPGEAAQAGEAFSALRRLGKRVELRLYTGEDHWPGFWSEVSLRDFAARVFTWFDEHLAGRPHAAS